MGPLIDPVMSIMYINKVHKPAHKEKKHVKICIFDYFLAEPDVSTYQYEESSGYYYDSITGLYYDANSQVSLQFLHKTLNYNSKREKTKNKITFIQKRMQHSSIRKKRERKKIYVTMCMVCASVDAKNQHLLYVQSSQLPARQYNLTIGQFNYIPRRKSGIYWIQVRRAAAAAVEISLWTR